MFAAMWIVIGIVSIWAFIKRMKRAYEFIVALCRYKTIMSKINQNLD